ncbi:Molybdopterin-guanine dinucleotide biosynthesis protein A [Microbacterium sp. cf046]|uniref:molybdenum cofactor guanylyltransferase n=1 Tax=Microbacterium sp. cf046 TaxID=1761803 RepID=UPI0008DFFB0A|nr:molybdenum cofactor guanylyltransferase [Microbacterium sp. cf046]SFS16059.1 Molybdopterin-guanine dinucleotide biosynthesis protein A [Microbacterium sp. cf046]
MNDLAAILLAGGRGSRMGGVHKPLLEVGGATLLDAAILAARSAGADPIVGVGDPAIAVSAPAGSIAWVREDPPFGGPVAAIIAALPLIATRYSLVLACDLPRVGDAVRVLQASPIERDGTCLADASGRPQWLTGLYETERLRLAADALPDAGRDASMRSLLGGLAITVVAASDDIAFDIDTWDDLTEARRRNP